MELRPGYKPTDMGVIPKEWECMQLGRFISLQRGHDLTWRDRRQGSVPVVGAAGQNGFHDTAIAKAPGVVLGRSGASFGQAHYCPRDFWPHNTALYVTDFRGNDPLFVYYFLRSIDFSRHNSGGAQQSLNRNFISPIVISVPRPLEQQSIAVALSDVDALLGALDRLIAKKRDIKQATMQQLLTGQTRLPGFTGEWISVRSAEIGLFKGGTGFPTRWQGVTNGAYPLFKVSDMRNYGNETYMANANNYISETVRRELGAIVFPAQTIVFAKVGAAIFLERKKILTRASCLDNNMAGYILDRERADCRFVHYLMLNTRLSDLASTTALPSLNGRAIGMIQFLLPSLPEQTAIVSVLSDMDTEIDAIEARRAKTRHLKQAMMQELLTGRIRLIKSMDN
jgi:type I restriction enzyme, S subunit